MTNHMAAFKVHKIILNPPMVESIEIDSNPWLAKTIINEFKQKVVICRLSK